MAHTLTKLPFNVDSLEPYISKETLDYHHGKHHAGYVNKLNALIEDTSFVDQELEDIIQCSSGAIFNNASQVYNHDFYFNGMSIEKSTPSKQLLTLIERDFSSLESFKNAFLSEASNLFGSGWVWLSIDHYGKLVLNSLSNASNPITLGYTPLLNCDVWEHAYYIDYRNDRVAYLDKWWNLINWDFVSKNLDTFIEEQHGVIESLNYNSELSAVSEIFDYAEHVDA